MLKITHKGKQVQYAGEVINPDGKHTVLIVIDGNYREVGLSEVTINMPDETRDITDKRRFCYVCSKIVRGSDWVRMPAPEGTQPIYRHGQCHAGSRKWMNSAQGKSSPHHNLFKKEAEETPKRLPRKQKPKSENPCCCGCGTTGTGNFRPGHDAKLKSKMIANIKAGNEWADGLESISIEYGQLKWVDLLSKMLTKYKK